MTTIGAAGRHRFATRDDPDAIKIHGYAQSVSVIDSATMTPPRQAHNVRAILAGRGFRRLLGVRVVSQIGDGLFQAGLGGSVLFNPQQETSAAAIAVGFAVLLLPYSAIGPYVGVFLDRWSRRSVLYLTNMMRASLVVLAATMIWLGRKEVLLSVGDVAVRAEHLLIVFALGIIGLNRLFLAGISAATPHVVEDRRLVTANSLSGTLGSFCFSLGLGAAVLLLRVGLPTTFHGYAVLSALATMLYIASALLARVSYQPGDLGPDDVERRHGAVWSEVIVTARGTVAGVRHLAAKRGAAYAMLVQSGFRVLFGVLAMATLLLFRNYFAAPDDVEGSISGLGLLFIGGSLGVVTAAFVTPPVARRIGGWRWIVWLIASLGVIVPASGLPFRPELLVIAVFAVNVAAQGMKIVVDTALQHECADEYRGRVFSINDTTFNLAFVIGLFIAVKALPDDGHSPAALLAVSVGFLALAAWYAAAGGRWARRVGDDIAGPSKPPPASPI